MSALDDFRAQNPAYKDVPDDKLADGVYNKFYASKMSRDDFNSKIGGASAAPAQQDTSLAGRVTQDVKNRFDTGAKIMTTPGQNPASVGLQMAGKVVAGTAGDIVGEVGKSAWDMLPESIKTNIKNDPITKAAVVGAQKVGDVYGAIANSDYMKKHPEALANMESLKDIAAFLPMGKAAGATQKVAGKAIPFIPVVGPIAKGIAAPSEAKQKFIVDQLHKTATDTIERVKSANVKFKPDEIQSLHGKLDAHPDIQEPGEQSARPETSRVVKDMKDVLQKGNSSLNNLIGYRDSLADVAKKGGQDGTAAIKTIKMLDETLDKVPELLKHRNQWGVYKLGKDIETATALSDISTTKARSAFQKIVDSNYFKSFDTKTQELLKTAAKGKASGRFMDTIGKLRALGGSSIPGIGKMAPALELAGALAMGHPGIAAGIGGVMAAGKGGELVQRGLGADVLKHLRDSQ